MAQPALPSCSSLPLPLVTALLSPLTFPPAAPLPTPSFSPAAQVSMSLTSWVIGALQLFGPLFGRTSQHCPGFWGQPTSQKVSSVSPGGWLSFPHKNFTTAIKISYLRCWKKKSLQNCLNLFLSLPFQNKTFLFHILGASSPRPGGCVWKASREDSKAELSLQEEEGPETLWDGRKRLSKQEKSMGILGKSNH